MTRQTLAVSASIGALALLLWAGVAGATPGEESEPRLILPGDRVVGAGQLIRLRWTPADSVSELEILLSVDGGRTYSVCVSPELDPDRCDYLWRVPNLGCTTLRLRIRYNRGGREIEGAPTAPLSVSAISHDRPEPLGLPPVEGAGGRAPKPTNGRGNAPITRSASGSCEISDQLMPPRRPSSRARGEVVSLPPTRRPAAAPALGTAPQFVPPRL